MLVPYSLQIAIVRDNFVGKKNRNTAAGGLKSDFKVARVARFGQSGNGPRTIKTRFRETIWTSGETVAVSLKGALPPGWKVYTEREEHTEGRNRGKHFVSCFLWSNKSLSLSLFLSLSHVATTMAQDCPGQLPRLLRNLSCTRAT